MKVKSLAFFLFALVSNLSFATEERIGELQTAIERDAQIFQSECSDFETAVTISENCIATATRIGESEQELSTLLSDLEANAFLAETHCGQGAGFSEIGEVLQVGEVVEEAEQTQCLEEEVDAAKANCFKEIKCVLASAALPFSMARQDGCVSRENNCLAHVATAALDLVWTTITDVGRLLKNAVVSGWKWMWGIEDETSDTQAAIQDLSDEDVEEASENPEGFFTRVMQGISTMFMEWVRTDLFCEEWEGEPHFGECTKPMKEWKCLGCGTKIKGICASFGAIGGLLLESFATGGVISALAKGARGASVALKIIKGTDAYKNSIKAVASTAKTSVGNAIGKTASSAGRAIAQTATATGRAALGAGRATLRGLREGFERLESTGIFDQSSALLAKTATTTPASVVATGARAAGRGLKATGKGILAVDDAAFDAGWNSVDGTFNFVGRAATRGRRAADTAQAASEAAEAPIAFTRNLSDSERLNESERVLGRELNPDQRQAVIDAHNIGRGEVGKDGGIAGLGNYTPVQIATKARILRRAGFESFEARTLMEQGITGFAASMRAIGDRIMPIRRPRQAPVPTPRRRPERTLSDVNVFEIEGKQSFAVPTPFGDNVFIFGAGKKVSFPRTRGGRSDGRIAFIDPETKQVTVLFTENGQEMVKAVSPLDLRPTLEPLEPIRVTPAPRPRQTPAPALRGRPERTLSDVRISEIEGRPMLLVPISGSSRQYSFSPGVKVSFPRTRGGRSDGRIAFIDPETKQVTVRFTENGQEMVKAVSPLDLRPTLEPLEPIRVTPAPRPRQTPAPASRGKPEQTLSDVRVSEIEGRPMLLVPIAGSSRQYSFSPGVEVSFPRTRGGRSDGRIAFIDPETKQVTVRFTENGNEMVKTVSPFDILPPSPAPTPARATPAPKPKTDTNAPSFFETSTSVSPAETQRILGRIEDGNYSSVLATKGLVPKRKYVLESGQTIYLSDVVNVEGRLHAWAFVEHKGKVYPRLVYKSNSQGIFRLADYVSVRNGNISWYSKGLFGEEYMSIPSDMQRELLQKTQDSVRNMQESDLVEVVSQDKSANLTDLAMEQKVNFKKETIIAIPNNKKYPTRTSGYKIPEPEAITIQNREFAPDFSSPISTYKTNTKLAGDVDVYVYKSQNGKAEFTVFRDSGGKIWFADIKSSDSVPINQHGISSIGYEYDGLTAPRWEYTTQIHLKYVGEGHKTDQSYSSNWEYLKQIPEIQEWYKVNNIPIP